jgi:hypothetical protein
MFHRFSEKMHKLPDAAQGEFSIIFRRLVCLNIDWKKTGGNMPLEQHGHLLPRRSSGVRYKIIWNFYFKIKSTLPFLNQLPSPPIHDKQLHQSLNETTH